MEEKRLFNLIFEYQGDENITPEEIMTCIEYAKRYRGFPTWMKVVIVESIDD